MTATRQKAQIPTNSNHDGSDLEWRRENIIYQCWFGEIPLFKLRFPGWKAYPNVFEIPQQPISPPPITDGTAGFVYSLPCSADLKKGIYNLGEYFGHVTSVYRHYHVDTSGSFENYMKRFKGKTLNNLRRKLKRIESSNTTVDTLSCFRRADEVETFLEIAKGISRLTYQERHLGMSLPVDSQYKKNLADLAANDKFRGYVLYFENRPIAYNLCPIYGKGILLYDYTGYHPDFSKYSPGFVLQFKIIENAFYSPDIMVYDLCTGEGRHKREFATGHINCCDVYYLPSTKSNLVVIRLRMHIENFAESIVAFLGKLGFKDKIKKLLRRRPWSMSA
jgi:hypothetical protein